MRRKPTGKNTPLGCKIEKGVLTISIGINVIAFSSMKGDGWVEVGDLAYEVTDVKGFAKDVMYSLLREAEDGSSPLTELFDRAIQDAIEDGSIAVSDTPINLMEELENAKP